MDGEDDEGLGDEDLLQTPRGLTDLEIGMYALLGVFCLAILVFLINCVSYALKYPHKELGADEGGPEGGAPGPHAHDWVWLGSEGGAELGLSPHRDDEASLGVLVMDSSLGALEEGSQLLNGGGGMVVGGVPGLQKHVQGQVRRSPEANGAGSSGGNKEVKGDSPTSKRKRVKFTTFSTVAERGSPTNDSIGSGTGGDIQWVCRDVELNDSKELRNYMERLSDGVLRDVV